LFEEELPGMPAKQAEEFSQEVKKDFDRQMGCMACMFQIFDRRRLLTGRQRGCNPGTGNELPSSGIPVPLLLFCFSVSSRDERCACSKPKKLSGDKLNCTTYNSGWKSMTRMTPNKSRFQNLLHVESTRQNKIKNSLSWDALMHMDKKLTQ